MFVYFEDNEVIEITPDRSLFFLKTGEGFVYKENKEILLHFLMNNLSQKYLLIPNYQISQKISYC